MLLKTKFAYVDEFKHKTVMGFLKNLLRPQYAYFSFCSLCIFISAGKENLFYRLTLRRDKDVISLYDIHSLSRKQGMRILKLNR